MTAPHTERELRAALEVLLTVAAAIRELGSVPSGELYARLMDVLNIHHFDAILDRLKEANLIKVENHLITWIGPK